MGKPAATLGSFHVCPRIEPGPKPHVGGPAITASPDVLFNGQPALRVDDKLICLCSAPDTVAEGSVTVFINGKPAARLGDGTAHGGKLVIGHPNITIGDGEGTNPLTASANLDHIPAPPATFAEALQRLDAAGNALAAARQTGEPLPTSPYSTADKMRLAEEGLQEKYIVRVVKNSRTTDADGLGRPGKPATHWTTTFSQVEHCDHDAQLICEAVGVNHDPNEDYTLLLIDQEAAREQCDMISFIPTNCAIANFMHYTATTDEDLLPVQPLVKRAMTPANSFYYESLCKIADEQDVDLNDPERLIDFAKDLGHDEEMADVLKARRKLEKKFGANSQFLGNGLTNDVKAGNPHTPFGPAQRDRSYGVAEVYSYDRNPKTQGEPIRLGILQRVPLKRG